MHKNWGNFKPYTVRMVPNKIRKHWYEIWRPKEYLEVLQVRKFGAKDYYRWYCPELGTASRAHL